MQAKVTEQGVVIPKGWLEGVDKVEIRREGNRIVLVPILQEDPIWDLGSHPVEGGVPSASENLDSRLYGAHLMTVLFLDASYIIALELSDDQNHEAALRHWRSIRGTTSKLVTTSYIFDEIVTFLNSRNHHAKAVETGNRLLNSPSVHLIQVDETLFLEGWQFFQRYSDKSYSLTDSISFLVMHQNQIETALTFDKHFKQAGFVKLPELS